MNENAIVGAVLTVVIAVIAAAIVFAIVTSMGLLAADSLPPEDSVETSERFVCVDKGAFLDTGYKYRIFVDTETGVEYLRSVGSSGMCIVPLYNTDGSLRTHPEFIQNHLSFSPTS